MLASVGEPVVRLVRVRIGPVRLVDLAPGEVRELSGSEREALAPRQAQARADDAAATQPAPPGSPAEARRRGLRVAIDGPGSSGKSSIGAGAARALGYRFFDTGILYRGLAWLATDSGVSESDPAALRGLIPRLDIVDDGEGLLSRVVVDGRDVTDRLHDAAVDRIVSAVARVPQVREALLPVQRTIAHEAPGGVILAGRDIGTVVLPDADLKLWLEVSLEERARRRSRQRGHAAGSGDERQVLDELRRRDGIDSSREAAPLVMPEGAVRIRTDGLALAEAVERVVDLIRAAEHSG
jgi:cytidylate kinase